MNKAFFPLLILLSLSACAEKLHLTPVTYNDMPGWQQRDHRGALKAFSRSCEVFLKKQPNQAIGPVGGEAAHWQQACRDVNQADAKNFFEKHFTPLSATSTKGSDGLYTGYFEIALSGSKKRGGKFQHPLYRKPPPELSRFTREEIENGALKGKGLELVWVDDPVRLFFLHIQGSGIVNLKEGGSIRVGYDGQNGQAYKAIGRYLIDEGCMEKDAVTAPAIKRWLYDNPERQQEVMNQNPSYVYFKIRSDLSPADGAVGAQGVPLEPFHSLAVDKRFFGYGIPMWLETTLPELENQPERAFSDLFIAQDTGGAIRGAIRGDVYFGRGEYAEALAGNMKQRGRLWVLLPNELAATYAEEE